MKKVLSLAAAFVLLFAIGANAATATDSKTANVTVTVANEAAVTAATTVALASSGTTFADYTATSTVTYKVRVSGGGTGSITAEITTDFSPTGGPSVGTPPTTGDALTYTCSVSGVGSACSGTQTTSTTATTNVVSFSANDRSSKAGDTVTLDWTLSNDPQYKANSYTAVVTYTISAT